MNGVVDDHELLYPLQGGDTTPLHLAACGGHTTCVEHLLSTPGIDVNIQDQLRQGIVETVDPSDAGPIGAMHYLLHHAVIREDKLMTKLCIVNDTH